MTSEQPYPHLVWVSAWKRGAEFHYKLNQLDRTRCGQNIFYGYMKYVEECIRDKHMVPCPRCWPPAPVVA